MISSIKQYILRLLRWSERYTKTDMVYLASGHFWFGIGRAIATGSGFLLTIGFANLLDPVEYGMYKYVLAGAGLISIFTLGGIVPAIQRALAKGYTNVIRPMVRYALTWNTPAFIISLGVSAYYLFNDNLLLSGAFAMVAFSMYFSAYSITKSFFSSTGQFRLATYFGSVRTIVSAVLLLGALFLTKNILVILFVYFASQIGMNLITYYRSLRHMQPKSGDEYLAETKRYSFYASALRLVMVPVQYLDQFLLFHFLGPVALATYTIAQGPTRELRTLAANVVSLAFPKLARKEAGEHVKARTVPRRTWQFFLILAALVALYVAVAPTLFTLFFPKYLPSILYSQLFALTILFQPRNLADTFLFAHSGIRNRYAATVPSSLIQLGLFVALIPPFGILGAIAAIFIGELVSTIVIFYLYWRFERQTKK